LLQLPTANSLIGFLPMIAIFAIFYFLLFLPMQRQKRANGHNVGQPQKPATRSSPPEESSGRLLR
jgi:hypothetical protein